MGGACAMRRLSTGALGLMCAAYQNKSVQGLGLTKQIWFLLQQSSARHRHAPFLMKTKSLEQKNEQKKVEQKAEQKAGPGKIEAAYYQAAYQGIQRVKKNILRYIAIAGAKIDYILAAKIAGGHVILADSHGVGKTSLARALAASIDWSLRKSSKKAVAAKSFNRIQCTVDLLPQDILGFNRFDMQSSHYTFNPGPIFAHFVLCDEINLLTPKTQGSFFQAMEEQRVSIEGETYKLPYPFFIIATMNLRGQHLFPLPAPQLDRFMVQLSMGYPSQEEEIKITQKHGKEDAWEDFKAVAEVGEMLAWQKLADSISIHKEVIEYIVQITRRSRSYPGIQNGLSPRSAIKMSRIARALALVRGKDYVTIDLIKELALPVFSHRLEFEDPSVEPAEALAKMLKEIRAP